MLIPQAIVQQTIGNTTLFDSTLGSDQANIDTGDGGIAAGFNILDVWILGRTTEAVVLSTVNVTLNNDTGGNYDFSSVRNANATVSGTNALAAAAWNLPFFGSSAQAGAATVLYFTIPSYTQTTFHKSATLQVGHVEDTAADARNYVMGLRYRSTTAISRMTVTAGAGNLLTGTRLLVIGR